MASTEIPADARPPWVELPREITATILRKLGAVEILTSAQQVCTTWRRVCQDVDMWWVIDMRKLRNIWDNVHYDMVKMCYHAVDRSQGQLVDLNIEHFGTNDLLVYISKRSSQLRRLRLVCCYKITGEGLVEAIKNFPLLEELHLYYTYIDDADIEAIGLYCPLLKSFKLNFQGSARPVECDFEALAIAGNMPKLQHLQLFGNKMTNEGLQAILDGCRQLESLDLRQCFNVSLGENLGKLCSQRIKDLRRPHDSTDDYEFNADIDECESFDEVSSSEFSDMDTESESESDDHLEFSDASSSSEEPEFDWFEL